MSFPFAAVPKANTTLPEHTATILDFYALPAKTHCQLCYVHPFIVYDIIPTGIELLEPSAKKPDIDRIVAETKQTLAKIREEQKYR